MTLEITLAGSVIDLGLFDYSLAVAHGRSDVTANPTASKRPNLCYVVTLAPYSTFADTVAISFNGVDRFTGAISDLNVSFISTGTPTAITTITAMGNLAKLGYTNVGASGYSEQTARQRVEDNPRRNE